MRCISAWKFLGVLKKKKKIIKNPTHREREREREILISGVFIVQAGI